MRASLSIRRDQAIREVESAATFLRSLGYAVAPPRPQQAEPSAALRLDAEECLLICGDRSVSVTPNQLRALQSLFDAGGRWCKREQLQLEVWGADQPQIGRLYVLMHSVREKLRVVTGTEEATIVSSPRKGYRLALRAARTGEGAESL